MVRYRPAVKIILRVLECIARYQSKDRALKTHVIQCANLKTTSGEKYLKMLQEAGYIVEMKEKWGGRTVIALELTELGKERYNWFKRINSELFESDEWSD